MFGEPVRTERFLRSQCAASVWSAQLGVSYHSFMTATRISQRVNAPRPKVYRAGWRSSLSKLAALVEAVA